MRPKRSTQNRGEDSKVHGHDSNERFSDAPAIDKERGWFSGEGNTRTNDWSWYNEYPRAKEDTDDKFPRGRC